MSCASSADRRGCSSGGPVPLHPRREPAEAEQADRDERRLPAPRHREPHHRSLQHRAEARAGVEDARGERALALREPFGDGRDASGEVRRLTQAQEESREREAEDGRREGMGHRRDTPNEHADREAVRTPGDRPYGLRDYTVRDLSGYLLGFGHYIYSAGPRVEIERMDVPVRLEKRLAALLQDLAEYKRMSLTSCLEEILLHTCEPLGDGVASPHTRSQLRYIQKLKAKHGIDYDCHASYRFVERA